LLRLPPLLSVIVIQCFISKTKFPDK